MTSTRRRRRHTRLSALALCALGVFLVATLFFTWPLLNEAADLDTGQGHVTLSPTQFEGLMEVLTSVVVMLPAFGALFLLTAWTLWTCVREQSA